MLKLRYFLLLARRRLANITSPYLYGRSSMLPLYAVSLFPYRQTRGLLASKSPKPPPYTLFGMRRVLLFFSVGAGLLILTACAGGSSDGSSSSSSPSPNPSPSPPGSSGVELTFAPIEGGFVISNQSDFSAFGDFVFLNITATNGTNVVEVEINITEFSGGSYNFTGLHDQSYWTFTISGIFQNRSQQEVEIDFIWQDNRQDHASGGIRPGFNTDGDGRADSVDDDDDNDGLKDNDVREQQNNTDGVSCSLLEDCDGDTIGDIDEEAANCVIDTDCDSDGIGDEGDGCPAGETNWTSNSSSDNDGDGCRDSDEDTDDDGDGLADGHEREQQNNTGGVSCSLLEDCDNDTIKDIDEAAANCVIEVDCDGDTIRDGDEASGCVLDRDCDDDGIDDSLDQCLSSPAGWTSDLATDNDRDGCRDADEDIDNDGDGLIEIETAEELDAVRYALNGNGSRLSADEELDTTGCGDGDTITSCSGYELVANISLISYASADGGKGWRPLGNDTDSGRSGCQGAAFDGTFEGNGWTISDLNINRSAEDCVGLFGHIAGGSEIRNLTLHAETVIGNNFVGGLVGAGEDARIYSSSVLVAEVSGTGGSIGGLVGDGNSARIYSSSVVASVVSGTSNVGSLVGAGEDARIYSSAVVANEVSAPSHLGGLVGGGLRAWIYSSSVLVGRVNGGSNGIFVGGLVGFGEVARVHSSSVVAGVVKGQPNILAPLGNRAVGGLTGNFANGRTAYSYVVSGSDTDMLSPLRSGARGVASYWDNETSGTKTGGVGSPKSSDELRMPTDYERIYVDWNKTNIFGGDVPLAVWCDRDNSGSIEAGEEIDDNLIWDFGTSGQYPAIRCTPIAPADWRGWWFLNGTTGKPQLNQTRLDEALNQ